MSGLVEVHFKEFDFTMNYEDIDDFMKQYGYNFKVVTFETSTELSNYVLEYARDFDLVAINKVTNNIYYLNKETGNFVQIGVLKV